MKRFKLIAKFFFEQKCKEIWKFVKTLPIVFMCISFLLLVAGVLSVIAVFMGYCFFLIVPSLKGDKDVFNQYICVGMGIFILGTFTLYVIYLFASWIKENIILAKERAERELGLTRYSSTQFTNIPSKDKHREK